MNKFYPYFSYLCKNEKFMFLFIGSVNTIFGYIFGVILYTLAGKNIGVFFVAIIANIVSITMSFTTYKFFVFKTKGNWIKEYFRAYIVYGFTAIVGIASLTLLVDYFGFKFWIAQGLIIILLAIFSYLGHKKITFNINSR